LAALPLYDAKRRDSMIKRLTRSMLATATLAGLCLGLLSVGSLRADETSAIPEPVPLDSYETDGHVSDCDNGTGTLDASGSYDLAAGRRGWLGGASCATPVRGCQPYQYGRPDLFYNFYMPNNCGGVPAQLYIAPRPVPALVGHTYYTYQPFMPHEFTYPHHRTYRRFYDEGRGMTRAKATWYCEPVSTTLKGVRNAIRLPR
jgi:hypothetical protein